MASLSRCLGLYAYMVTIAGAFLMLVTSRYLNWLGSPLSGQNLSSEYICEAAPYISRIVSYEPLMIHLENFITPYERQYLATESQGRFERSLVTSHNGKVSVATSDRTSSTALIPFDDPVSLCIRKRAADFQGFLPERNIEMLQVVQYLPQQEYRAHYDWSVKSGTKRQRISTIFGIIDDGCENCGTRFPDLSVDWSQEDPQWCRLVDCDDLASLTFKAVAGSALFWKNLHANGTGDLRTLHAGLPVQEGKKVGLNIWTVV